LGSWNETCGISNLPIRHTDKVRVFILADNRRTTHRGGGGGFCYPEDCWTPYALPIQGKYNDYGSVEEVVDNYTARILFDKITSSVLHEDSEETEHHHVDLKNPDLDWEGIVTSISQEEMKIKNVNLGVVFVLEDIYQAMISMNRISSTSDKGGYLYEPISSIIDKEIPEFYRKIAEKAISKKKLQEQLSAIKNGEITGSQSIKDQLSFSLLLEEIDGDYNSILSSTISNHKSRYFIFYKEELEKLALEGKTLEDENVQLIFNELKEFACFNFALSSLRKGWQPQFGKGSQDSDYEAHIKLMGAVASFCAKKIAEHEYHYGEMRSEYSLSSYQIEHNEKENKRRKLLAFE
jgi:hypothetical protein